MTKLKSFAELKEAIVEPPPRLDDEDAFIFDSEYKIVLGLRSFLAAFRHYGVNRIRAFAEQSTKAQAKALMRKRGPGAYSDLTAMGVLRVIEDIDAVEKEVREGLEGVALEERSSPPKKRLPAGSRKLREFLLEGHLALHPEQKQSEAEAEVDLVYADAISRYQAQFERVTPPGFKPMTTHSNGPAKTAPRASNHREPGLTTMQYIMDHFEEGRTFTTEEASQWMEERGWNPYSCTGAISLLKGAGLIGAPNGTRGVWVFLKPVPDNAPRPIGATWLREVRAGRV